MRLVRTAALALATAASCLPALAQTPSGADNQYLKGQYAFLLKGVTLKTTSNQPVLAVLIGSFTADGKGNITSGNADINSADKYMQQMAIYGTYNINADGTGTLGLNTPLGSTSYALSVVAGPTATIQGGLATSLANPTGSGSFHLQDPASFAVGAYTPQDGQFLVSLSGETPCSGTCLTSGTGPLYTTTQGLATIHLNQPQADSAGTFTLPVVVTAGTQYTTANLTGTVSLAGVRGGRTLQVSGGSSIGITQIAMWEYGAGEFYMMTVNPHSSAVLESGTAEPAQ